MNGKPRGRQGNREKKNSEECRAPFEAGPINGNPRGLPNEGVSDECIVLGVYTHDLSSIRQRRPPTEETSSRLSDEEWRRRSLCVCRRTGTQVVVRAQLAERLGRSLVVNVYS